MGATARKLGGGSARGRFENAIGIGGGAAIMPSLTSIAPAPAAPCGPVLASALAATAVAAQPAIVIPLSAEWVQRARDAPQPSRRRVRPPSCTSTGREQTLKKEPWSMARTRRLGRARGTKRKWSQASLEPDIWRASGGRSRLRLRQTTKRRGGLPPQ